MGAAIGIGLASMGNAFMKSYNDTIERKRRQEIEDEERAWKKEDRDAVRQERAEKAQLKQDLSDAYAPRTTMTGTVTQSDAGQVFSATPENARAMQDMLAAEAELKDGAAPAQQAGYAITGSMSKGHQIAAGAAPEGAADTPDARNERMLNAYRKNGQWDKAVTMESAQLEADAKRLNLSIAQTKYLKDKANEDLQRMVPMGASWWKDAEQLVTNSKSGPLANVTAESVVSPDGKTVEMFAIGPDGRRQSVWKLPTGSDGWAKLMEMNMQADLPTVLQVVNGYNKQAQERADKERQFGIDEAKANSEIALNKDKGSYYRSAGNAKAADASNSQGVNMDDLDKTLDPLFKTKDENGVEVLNTDGMMFVRKLALSTPEAASGDATGAALRAHKAYTVALSKTGGDHQKAVAAINQAMAPKPGAASPATPPSQATPAGQPGAPASTRVAPQVQAARDSDARAILQGELAQARQRLAAGDSRAQADIEALQRELRAQGVPVSGTAMQEAVAPAPQAQPAAAAKPLVTMEAARKVDPLSGKSQQQIREIKAELQRERKRWAGEPNAGKRIAEIDALLNRIENGRY